MFTGGFPWSAQICIVHEFLACVLGILLGNIARCIGIRTGIILVTAYNQFIADTQMVVACGLGGED